MQGSTVDFTSNLFAIRPEILSVIVVTLILFCLSLAYFIILKRTKDITKPHGFVVIIQMFVNLVEKIVIDILGKRSKKLTPLFIVLFAYLIGCNLIGLLGLELPTSSLTVTLSLSLIMFVGTFAIGFRYQKLSYLTRFCINYKSKKTGKKYPLFPQPLNILEVITPLISMSFRLWGNMFAGSIIISLWYALWASLTSHIPVIGCFSLFVGIVSPPIHGYFDVFVGIVQAFVFTMLTLVYWSLAKEHGNYSIDEKEEKVLQKINHNL